jgi:hypothetical protein
MERQFYRSRDLRAKLSYPEKFRIAVRTLLFF